MTFDHLDQPASAAMKTACPRDSNRMLPKRCYRKRLLLYEITYIVSCNYNHLPSLSTHSIPRPTQHRKSFSLPWILAPYNPASRIQPFASNTSDNLMSIKERFFFRVLLWTN